jgi:hypothetical protein|nr:MAG TPA_asm: hypothetical protein [Caudoviricetes sp.]
MKKELELNLRGTFNDATESLRSAPNRDAAIKWRGVCLGFLNALTCMEEELAADKAKEYRALRESITPRLAAATKEAIKKFGIL